jgi:translocation and assembly module TamB
MTSSSTGKLDLDGNAQLDLSYPSLRKGVAYLSAPVKATLQAEGFDVAFLSTALPGIRQVGGLLRAKAKLEGTLGAPSVEGEVEWNEGRLSLQGFGDYRQIHLLVHGTLDRIELRELKAQSAGGTAIVKAEANRTGERFSLVGSIDVNKFPVVADDQPVATVTFRSTLEGELSSRVINIRRLQIPRAEIELPEVKKKDLQRLDRPEDIMVLGRRTSLEKAKRRAERGGSASAGTPSARTTRELYIVVEAQRNIWVKSSDVNIEVGLAEGFNIQYANELAIFGQVHLLRGRADVLGRRFDVQRDSEIRFGGAPTRPYVNITAIHVNDHEKVKVFITVQGQGTNVTIKPSSDPPYSESEIYTLIATGHLTLKRGSGSSAFGTNQAASIVGSLAATELRKSIASKLPLDVLSIEAGEGGGLTGTKLEAGTYVSDKIYIGYAGRVGARPDRGENTNAVRFEYQITPRWSLEAEYGDARAGGADLIWSRDY